RSAPGGARPLRLLPSRRTSIVLAVFCALASLALLIGSGGAAGQGAVGPAPPPPGATRAQVAQGRTLFLNSCSSCHGLDAGGVHGRGPSLRGVGERAAD